MPVSGPQFLKKLEKQLNRQVSDIESNPLHSHFEKAKLRLSAFRQALELLAKEYKTFGPLLKRIQAEYEYNLSELSRDLKYSEKERVKTVQELAELQKSVMEQEDLSDSAKLEEEKGPSKSKALEQLRQRTRLAHAQTRNERLESEKRELLAQIAKLERSEQEAFEKFEEEEEAKNLMFQEYAELQKQFDQYKDTLKNQEDPEILRMALDQCRKDLTKAHGQINRYKQEYDHVVPQGQYDVQERQLTQISSENDRLLAALAQLKNDNERMLATIKELSREVDLLRDKDAEFRIGGLMKEGVKKWKKETEMKT